MGYIWGYNPLIPTIDPNFQRDIQVAPHLQEVHCPQGAQRKRPEMSMMT